MVYSFQYTFLECQSCTAKIHCEECAQKVTDTLEKQADLCILSLDMKKKELSVETERMEEDDVIDILEDAGIFV